MVITYTINLTVTRPVDYDNDAETITEKAEWLKGVEARRRLEREVIQALRRLDGDCDCEVMDTAFKEDI